MSEAVFQGVLDLSGLARDKYVLETIEAPATTTRPQFMQLARKTLTDNPEWFFSSALNFGSEGWVLMFLKPKED